MVRRAGRATVRRRTPLLPANEAYTTHSFPLKGQDSHRMYSKTDVLAHTYKLLSQELGPGESEATSQFHSKTTSHHNPNQGNKKAFRKCLTAVLPTYFRCEDFACIDSYSMCVLMPTEGVRFSWGMNGWDGG